MNREFIILSTVELCFFRNPIIEYTRIQNTTTEERKKAGEENVI